MPYTKLNDLVLEMYRDVQDTPITKCKAWLLSCLARVIDFDRAYWADYDYSQFSPQHVVKFVSNGVDTTEFDLDRDEVRLLQDHCLDQNGIFPLSGSNPQESGEILVATSKDQTTDHTDRICLWRKEGARKFTSSDQENSTYLISHLIQIIRLNLHFYIHQHRSDTARLKYDSALTDLHGIVLAKSDDFVSTLQVEWPNWQGHRLPQGLMNCINEDKQFFHVGEFVVLELNRANEYCCIQARLNQRNNKLTPKERLVIKYLLTGMTYKQIGSKLDISPSTITNHVNNIYKKLNIKSKAQLMCQYL